MSGATRGIGRGIAAAFAAEGARVVLAASSQANLDRAAEEIARGGGVRPEVCAADLRTLAGCERVATGHYARLERDEATGEIRLLKALDDSRDQSYYLYDLTPSQLARALFPLGGLLKRDVRRLAREAGLPNWNKPDSQEICFVPAAEGPAGFIRKEAEALGVPLPAFAGSRPGPITDTCGRVLGRHDGTFPFTVGQRRGLGLAAGRPLYVLEVIPEEGRVVVGEEKDLYSRTIAIRNLNLLVPPPPAGTLPVLARVRSRQPEKPALLVLELGMRVRLVFE